MKENKQETHSSSIADNSDGQNLSNSQTDDINQKKEHDFIFTATGSEYFKIWIVNLFLTIITLGLYSPWATIRARRYIYTNTWLDDHNFDFHGDPKSILVGRAITTLLLALYLFGDLIHIYAPFIILTIMIIFFPWLIVKSLKFKLSNTSYRNIRFDFLGKTKDAYKAYLPLGISLLLIFLPFVLFSHFFEKDMLDNPGQLQIKYILPKEMIILLITSFVLAALIYPLATKNKLMFSFNNSLYGQHKFKTIMNYRELFFIYFVRTLILLLIFLLFLAISPTLSAIPSFLSFLLFPILLFVFYLSNAYLEVKIINKIFQRALLDDDKVSSQLNVIPYTKIIFTNLFLVVFTLGIAYPWAKMRLLKYRTEKMSFHSDDFNKYLGEIDTQKSALGDELVDGFDFDISF